MVAHTCKRTVQEVKRKGFTCSMRYRHRCEKVLYSYESSDQYMLGTKEKSRIPNSHPPSPFCLSQLTHHYPCSASANPHYLAVVEFGVGVMVQHCFMLSQQLYLSHFFLLVPNSSFLVGFTLLHFILSSFRKFYCSLLIQ